MVSQGDVTGKEADTAMMRLVAVFFEMTSGNAELADAQEGAGFDSMAFFGAPGALVAQLFVGPVPGTVDRFLDAMNMPRVQGGRSGRESVSDVTS